MTQITLTNDITVQLLKVCATDRDVLDAARVSTMGDLVLEQLVEEGEVEGVVKYLMKHRHGTPFEHNMFRFFVNAPIFVWREWHRHRIGFCVAADTEVWTESYAKGSGRTLRKKNIRELYYNWRYGVRDIKGRTRFLKSVYDQKFRVLNEETNLFESSKAESVLECGIKEIYHLETEHEKWNSLRCSNDHKVLTIDGWAKVSELSDNEMVYVNGKRNKNIEVSIPPSLRAGIGVWTSMKRKSIIQQNRNRCYICNERFEDEELCLDHVVPVVQDLTKALDVDNLLPACGTCHRIKTNAEQIFADRNVVAGSIPVRIKRKPKRVGEDRTYDISIKGKWHNFIANGIVVHNSYNEESARYTKLKPVFYLPPPDRPMMKVDGWKPGKPKFLRCTSEDTYEVLCGNLTRSYDLAYKMYEANLNMNIDPGLARDCLPVGIYSSCWVTCNARSLMAFLSLRTHVPTARDISYPLYEIEQAALQVETALSEHMPMTYKAFCNEGRRAP